jgi:hypothetical protein
MAPNYGSPDDFENPSSLQDDQLTQRYDWVLGEMSSLFDDGLRPGNSLVEQWGSVEATYRDEILERGLTDSDWWDKK